ncbi:MAG: RluA family pseudouridine synthase [Proteobacteria bacterium]|nr:RluA family pseudouridine synthase [Pseudomonadota bacterium]
MLENSNKVQLIRVLEPQQGQRIDNFLIRHLKGVPRSRVYRLIRRGEIRVNKKRCKPTQKLITGDEVRIPPYSGTAPAEPGKLSPGLRELLESRRLFENEAVLVINKPAGMAVHGGSGIRLGLIEAMRQIRPEWQDLELAHRLDRDTSGCLVIAKNTIFLKHIQKELKDKHVEKRYLALVHGQWPANLVQMAVPLKREAVSSSERVVRVSADGKPSLTRFTVVRRYREATLIEALPVTGRTHQIRVHCQHAGHGIVGDPKYTAPAAGISLSRVKTLCLHALHIKFTLSPGEGQVEVEAPIDKTLANLLDGLSE